MLRIDVARVAVVGLTVAVLSGCASGRARPEAFDRAELLSERTSPLGRSCRVAEFPATLPTTAELVDEAALVAETRELVGDRPSREGYVLFSMAYDRFGSNIRRTVIEHDISSSVADSIQKLVFAHRETLDEAPRDWGLRLRMEIGDSIRFRVGRQELCDPAPRDANLAYAMQHTYGSGFRMRGRVRENLVWMRLTVGPRGTVTSAEVERGTVGNTVLLQSLLEYVRSFFFYPALEDGMPTTGTISVPITIREG
jgi:hypothetical protein